MNLVALVGLVDRRGWLLLQERDEHAPIDPNKWCLVGGGIEPDESPIAAARRELTEETGIVCEDLAPLGIHDLQCAIHGQDRIGLFTARTSLTDDDVKCMEGSQIVFVAPAGLLNLDLTESTRSLIPTVLAAHSI